MQKTSQTDDLHQKIATLESKQSAALSCVSLQTHQIYEDLKPINLIKNTLQEVSASAELKNLLLQKIIQNISAYLSEHMIEGKEGNPIRKVMGAIFQLEITTVTNKHADTLVVLTENFLKKIFRLNKKTNH
ncbi:hypothetical protein AD998_20875 [bacterium 336/3]|nr:hypothetical protein AD998_20875 [bacterium 336/3]